MYDAFRFVLRSALGGAIVPMLCLAVFCQAYFGAFYYAPIIFLHPVVLLIATIPGGCVGLTLWFLCLRGVEPLAVWSRMAIGAGVQAVIYVLVLFLYLPTDQISLTHPQRPIVWTLALTMAGGTLAGLTCPSRIGFRKEPELTFRQRMQLYETGHVESESKESST